ncbi:MAG: hypothetical protein FJY09_06150 [Chlorobi bacterium]|nr:hypothetical protein [Chlorobiota bacterium]
MKRYDKQTEEQIEETMRLLDSLPSLKASPFFRVHVMERIDALQRKEFESGGIRGSFNVRLALGAMLVAVNIGSAALFFTSSGHIGRISDASGAIEQLHDDYAGPELAYYVETVDQSGAVSGREDNPKESGQPRR